MGTSWIHSTLSTPYAPSAARSTNASTAGATRSSNSPTPSSPRMVVVSLLPSTSQPPSTASSWLGQPLRRAPARTNRRRSPAEAARPPSTRRKPNARLRRGHERVASVRRGVQPRARLLLPPLAPLGRPAHRCRMGLPVHRPTQLRARESDRPRGRGARPPHAGRQRGRRRAGESVRAPVARGGRGHPPVRLRRRLRSREATARTGRPPRADPRPFAGGSPLPRRSEPRRPARPPPPDGRVVMARR